MDGKVTHHTIFFFHETTPKIRIEMESIEYKKTLKTPYDRNLYLAFK